MRRPSIAADRGALHLEQVVADQQAVPRPGADAGGGQVGGAHLEQGSIADHLSTAEAGDDVLAPGDNPHRDRHPADAEISGGRAEDGEHRIDGGLEGIGHGFPSKVRPG
ncbi:hypothetical protein RC1_0075 [Rhodospirillum centenum SW]|uniref:Uncharacterized protein n=1 Tax=Rhodospirillum centenum (strain ATCC 51521 / SW) TaxID=414684 RepID=B6IPY8_RHOCS|nr:hypothetical protein RC1_0075 [Rhodospirillum centenum SW]